MLEIISRIRQTKGLITERKIGDDILKHGKRKRWPVVERWVLDLYAIEFPSIVNHDPVEDGAAPPFHDPEGWFEWW